LRRFVMQGDPDMLHLDLRSDGGLIAVGLPWSPGVFVQEYWSQGQPWYAIANASARSVEIAVREWKGKAGRSLTDAWTIAPGTVQFHEIGGLLNENSGALVAISMDTNPVYGLLKPPRLPSRPIEWASPDDILTLAGLNGVGDRDANLSCRQTGLVFHPGQVVSLHFLLPGDLDTLALGETLASTPLRQAIIRESVSTTLFIREGEDQIVMEPRKHSTDSLHELTLVVEIPEATVETMAALLGRVRLHTGAGFSFARGLTVRPGKPQGAE